MAEEMGIFEVIYNCRAMRRIKPDPVPEDTLRRLIDAAESHAALTAISRHYWGVLDIEWEPVHPNTVS